MTVFIAVKDGACHLKFSVQTAPPVSPIVGKNCLKKIPQCELIFGGNIAF